jgi:hypothetical protein
MNNISNIDEDDDGDEISEGEDMNDNDEEDESDDNENNDDEEGDDDEYTVKKFIRTFNNGDYDAKFDDALGLDRSLDRNIILQAWPTRASYIKPDNWQERNRIGLERVKEQLETCIESAKDDPRFELELAHNTYGHLLMENEEPIVWHEPILDRYWDQLEAAIDQKKLL